MKCRLSFDENQKWMNNGIAKLYYYTHTTVNVEHEVKHKSTYINKKKREKTIIIIKNKKQIANKLYEKKCFFLNKINVKISIIKCVKCNCKGIVIRT